MSGTLNKVMLIGNLGRDPEMVHFQDGGKIAKIAMATSESYKRKDGDEVNITDWHNVVMRRGLADIAEKWLKKGQKIYVEGKIRTRTYEDNGVTKYITEIIADNMTMLGSRQDSAQGNAQQNNPENSKPENDKPKVTQPEANSQNESDDDLPF